VEGDALYSVGIIDWLQEYNVRKKFEYLSKRFCLCQGRGISVNPPADYSERFVRNVCKLLVEDPAFKAMSATKISRAWKARVSWMRARVLLGTKSDSAAPSAPKGSFSYGQYLRPSFYLGGWGKPSLPERTTMV